MRNNIVRMVAGLWLASSPLPWSVNCVQAQEAPHVHGLAEMDLVLLGDDLFIDFMVPAADLVGFEGGELSTEQRAEIERVVSGLKQPGKVITVEGRKCEQTSSEVFVSGLVDGHDHAGHVHHGEYGDHASFHIQWQWQCTGTDRLVIRAGIFSEYPSIEQVLVRWISEERQGSTRLTPSSAVLRLDQ